VCGLAGIINLKHVSTPNRAELEPMIAALRHRGPDQFGYLLDEGVGLAHARLSIVDVANGAQPIGNETEDVWIVYNGEAFNFPELMAELEAKGHLFRTRSDTEVLVHLYEEYGDDFVLRLNGQFAFALWDARRRRLLLCRDPVGILPLFYLRENDRLYFGSEVKAVVACGRRPTSLDPIALDQLLTFWSPIAPRSAFAGISQLAPGERLIVERGRVRLERYADISYPRQGEHPIASADRAADQVRAALALATRIRLRGDVPVAAYLSGGLDSSIVAALARAESNARLRTFSLSFEDPAFDERPYQDQMTAWLGADHQTLTSGGQDILEHFERALWHAEAPLVRSAPIPMLQLSGGVHAAGYRVVLTGEGADEFFAGYDLFKELKIRRFWAKAPGSLRRPALLQRLYPYLDRSPGKGAAFARAFFGIGLSNPDAPLFSHLPRMASTARAKVFFSESLRSELTSDPALEVTQMLPADFSRWHALNRAQYLEAKLLLPGTLLASQGDRMLMANSVEGRFPFLDRDVIQLSTQIDPRLLMRGLDEKYLLKRAFSRELPAAITRRKKQPYRSPALDLLLKTGQSSELVRELLSPRLLEAYGYFDSKKVQMLLRKSAENAPLGESDSMAFNAVLTAQYLHHRFITRPDDATSTTPKDRDLAISRRPRAAA
jgi:asparagine synthase (glutamine-hydrolysing)